MLEKMKSYKGSLKFFILAFSLMFSAGILFTSPAFAQEETKSKAKAKMQETKKQHESMQKKAEAETKEKQEEKNESIANMYDKGLQHVQNGESKSALMTFETLLRKDPNNVNTMINLARAYHDLEQFDKANTIIENAIALDSTNTEAHLVRGIVKNSTGKQDEAIASYKKSIDLNAKDNPFAYNNLALIYIKDGDYSNAIPLLEKATQQKNDISYFYNNLGIAYEGNGELARAKDAFNQALNIEPGYEKASTNLARVRDSLGETTKSNGKQDSTMAGKTQ